METTVEKHSRLKLWRGVTALIASLVFFSPLTFTLFGDQFHFEKFFKKQDAFMKSFLSFLQKGETDKASQLLSPETRAEAVSQMGPLAAVFQKAGPLQSCHLVNLSWKGKGHVWEMFYYLDFEKGSGILDLKMFPEGNSYLVDTFYINSVDRTYRENYGIPLEGIYFLAYVLLLMAWALTLLSADVFVRCLHCPVKRKWLWGLFILLGFGNVELFWLPGTNFHFQWELFSLHLPVSGLSKNPLLNPWKIEMSLPLGMLIFLWKLRSGKQKES